jgi:hypothetical protein
MNAELPPHLEREYQDVLADPKKQTYHRAASVIRDMFLRRAANERRNMELQTRWLQMDDSALLAELVGFSEDDRFDFAFACGRCPQLRIRVDRITDRLEAMKKDEVGK